MRLLRLRSFPSRSTYCQRYRTAYIFLEKVIPLHGAKALREGVSSSDIVAVDQSKLRALGPDWCRRDRRKGIVSWGGIDRESQWGYSPHHKWIQGYSYEVVVTATKGFPVLPLAASVETANVREAKTFGSKIESIPPKTRFVLADAGYDCNEFGDRIEFDDNWEPTGCRFICSSQRRSDYSKPPTCYTSKPKLAMRERRGERLAFCDSRQGRILAARRQETVEPFNEWFKSLFEINHRVWHRGLANNRTQVLAAIFSYQLLLRYNRRRHRLNGQIKWIVDCL
jgi:hypothetical protein